MERARVLAGCAERTCHAYPLEQILVCFIPHPRKIPLSKTVAIVQWNMNDGIAEALRDELIALEYRTVYFRFDTPIPADADVILSFAPYGQFRQIPRQLAQLPKNKRPIFVHWSTENPPGLGLPWALNSTLATARAQTNSLMPRALRERMIRYRIMGDYLYAHRQGVLDVFVESSMVFADWYNKHGVPALFAPWGTVKKWYATLGLERDIGVLWMGQRRTPRRSALIEEVRRAVHKAGFHMHVADGVEHPFLYGKNRTHVLNRTQITLSVLAAAKHDNIFHYRFRLAAPNRSLVLTEQELPHCTLYRQGTHYAAADADALVERTLYYLRNSDARTQIAEQAYRFATEEFTLGNSVQRIMQAVERARSQ